MKEKEKNLKNLTSDTTDRTLILIWHKKIIEILNGIKIELKWENIKKQLNI